MIYIQVILGFIILVGGAEFLVRGGVSMASRMGVSPLVIGMTIVAIGTSAPELMVSINAAHKGATGLAVGNVIGSNIANVLLVFGLACVFSPMIEKSAASKQDGIFLTIGTILFFAFCLRGALDYLAGITLFGGIILFLLLSYWKKSNGSERTTEDRDDVRESGSWLNSCWGSAFLLIFGVFGLAFGSELLVRGGGGIAREFGVPEEVIGLTLFAFGTSLPELAASIIASMKGHADIGLGNIIGSNLFNVLGVAGAAALTAPLPVHEQIMNFDIWVMLISSAILVFILSFGWRASRSVGMLLTLSYVGYIWVQSIGVDQLMG